MNAIPFRRFLTACLGALLLTGPAFAAVQPEDSPDALEVNIESIMQPWKGDLPGMLDRRVIRVLTTYSKTFFFIDKGQQRGATHDIFAEFERSLNAQLAKEKKLKQRHLKVRIIFVPVTRDNLFTALNEGKGDIAAANLTITATRQQQVTFTDPIYSDIQDAYQGASTITLRRLQGVRVKQMS